MFLSEVWAEAHWNDAHIQVSEWSDYRADLACSMAVSTRIRLRPTRRSMSRHSTNSLLTQTDANGDLMPPAGRPDLQYQPHSSLVTCKAGERVLLRFANLGFREAAMTWPASDEGGRQRCHADDRPRRHRHQLRDRHRVDGRRRELSMPSSRRQPTAALDRTTPMCSTTAATPGRTIWRTGGSEVSAPKCASIPTACQPQSIPITLGPNSRTTREEK